MQPAEAEGDAGQAHAAADQIPLAPQRHQQEDHQQGPQRQAGEDREWSNEMLHHQH